MKKVFIITASIFLFASCNFLDRESFTELSSDKMFSSETLAETVVTGAYSALMYDYTDATPANYNWDAYSSVLDPSIGLSLPMLRTNATADNSMFLTYWKRFYEGINRANDVIENIGRVPDMSNELKAKRIAECKFIRAYFYYRLNARYRGVPVYLENLAPSEYTKPRSSEEAVWQQIIDDCTACIQCEQLPDKYAASDSDYGRVTKGAAYALRGKTYLWLKDYENAQADFEEIGEMGYKLYDGKYADLFNLSNEKCDEMIFSVQMIDQASCGNYFSSVYGSYCTTGYGINQFYANLNFVESYQTKEGKAFNWDDYIPGYNEMSPVERSVYFFRNSLTDDEKTSLAANGADMSKYLPTGNEERIRAAYSDRDPRLDATVITPYSTYVGGSSGSEVEYTMRYPYRDWASPSFDFRTTQTTYMFYAIRKFVTVGRTFVNIYNNPVDVPVFRYADILLSLAEALNEQGNTKDAITYVNKVRARAGVALLNSNSDTQVSGQEDLRKRIRDEKKWELACEEVLYLEELRWGTWKDDKFGNDNGLMQCWGQSQYHYNWAGDHYLKWAIPRSEIEKNTNLTQNENWY